MRHNRIPLPGHCYLRRLIDVLELDNHTVVGDRARPGGAVPGDGGELGVRVSSCGKGLRFTRRTPVRVAFGVGWGSDMVSVLRKMV